MGPPPACAARVVVVEASADRGGRCGRFVLGFFFGEDRLDLTRAVAAAVHERSEGRGQEFLIPFGADGLFLKDDLPDLGACLR